MNSEACQPFSEFAFYLALCITPASFISLVLYSDPKNKTDEEQDGQDTPEGTWP